MPKDVKALAPPEHRKLPYPPGPPANMAPYNSTTAASEIENAVRTPPAGTNHRPSAPWSKEKDELLVKVRHQGHNWQPIAEIYFPDKSPNACRKRHERLMEKRNNANDWDSTKMGALAMAYKEVREPMWRVLADKMGGERWQVVESKCMEKGLKTLLNAGHAASRRAQSSGANPDFEDYTIQSSPHEHFRSHPNSDDDFNDSPIGPDPDHSLARPSPQSSHQVPPYNTQPYPTPSRGHTPPYPPPSRTFSNASSSAMSSSGFTPIMPVAPLFPSQLPRTRARQSSTESRQTLPSFRASFGKSDIPSMPGLPMTSMT